VGLIGNINNGCWQVVGRMWVSPETTNSSGGGRMVTRVGWGAEIGAGSSGWGCFKIPRLYGICTKLNGAF
jgi:hypothetical protein